jgi:ParB-like nuclease domain
MTVGQIAHCENKTTHSPREVAATRDRLAPFVDVVRANGGDYARASQLNPSPAAMPTKALTIEQVSPAALNPAAYNPRKMSDTARAALRRGIEAFGLVDPIIARRSDNLVIGGHQRLTAAKEMGLATVPVVYLDELDDQKAAALNVLLNNPSAQGEWDFGLLSGLLSELDAHGFDATLTGFDDKQLEGLLSWAPGNEGATASALGDVDYQLIVSCPGEHAQASLCEELEKRGLKCRLLSL